MPHDFRPSRVGGRGTQGGDSMAKKKVEPVSQNPYIKLVPSKGGRPMKVLTPKGLEQVAILSQYMATDEEIAAALSDEHERITVDTLVNPNNKEAFSEYKQKGQNKGKVSLRAWQFQSAKNGNVSMQMYLGKVYLKQREYEEKEQSVPAININVSAATAEDIEED